MRKAIVIVAVCILIVPIFGLLVSAGIGARLAGTDPPDALACNPNEALSLDGPRSLDRSEILCYQRASNAVLWRASAALLLVTVLVPVSFGGLAFTLGRRRLWLAHVFPWIVRPTMLALACLLALHGLLLVYTGLQLTVAVDYPAIFAYAGLVGLGFAGVALLIMFEAVRTRRPEPLRVTGLEIGSDRLPELMAQIANAAGKLNVSTPVRVIAGLDVNAFVTKIPVSLRGVGVLSADETLYLPACALRILDEKQFMALLGHELAHFRGKDVAFTERFIPSFLALRNAIETLTPDANPPDATPISGWNAIAKLPGLLLMQSIALVMAVAVARVRRARELEADRVATELSSPEAFAGALVKLSLFMMMWAPFRAANVRYLGTGRARSNLGADFLESAIGLLAAMDRDRLRRTVLSFRLRHPTDVHPPLGERIRALGLDPGPILDQSLAELFLPKNVSGGLLELEAALTAIENDWMSTPGTPVVTDSEVSLPDALKLRTS